MTNATPSPTVMFLANSAWNLAHFRAPLIDDLARSGARLVAVAPPDGSEKQLRDAGVEFAPIRLDRRGLSPLANLTLLRDYRRAIAAYRPDVVLAFTVKPNIWGSMAASTLGVPVINNVSGLGTAFIGRPLLKSVVARLYRLAFARSARVFFQNEDDREQFVRDAIVEIGQTGLLPGSGIDLVHFPMSPPRRSAPCRFLFIGRLLRDKGLEEIAEASRMLKADELDFEVALLGGDDPDNRSAIAPDRLQRWQRDGLVTLIGRRDDVRPDLADCDCLVLPSYREGMPRSVLEASAMGRPVIATDVPGCRQAVDDGVTGYLCRPRSAASLADAMRRMMTVGPKKREEMGRRGRVKMERQFSKELVVEQYREAIADALSRRNGR